MTFLIMILLDNQIFHSNKTEMKIKEEMPEMRSETHCFYEPIVALKELKNVKIETWLLEDPIEISSQINQTHNSVHEVIDEYHEGNLLHKCELCGESFTLKQDLDKHKLAIHKGIKPHKCRLCEACFGHKSYLD
jgi:uncharacterized protein YwqG